MHVVQFYEGDAFLVESVLRFVGPALAGEGDDAVLVIATPEHRRALDARLRGLGLDISQLEAEDRYISEDAAAVLAPILKDGQPESKRFHDVIDPLVRRAGRGGRRVRAFGEMVALLWQDGNADGAIALETLWDDLTGPAFSLFCAYPMSRFRGSRNGQPFLHICRAHTRVIPAETDATEADEDKRSRAVTLLQQQAGSLELEILERQRAESDARLQEAKLAMATTVAQLGVFELDLASYVVTCSEESRAHFGILPHEEVTFQRLMARVEAEDRGPLIRALDSLACDTGDFSIEFRIVQADGERRWLSIRGHCLQSGLPRVLGVTRDITERKRAAELLERAMAERTAELEATVADLEAFSYSISHDLRAPVRWIHGYAGLLTKRGGEQLNDECRGYVAGITNAATKMDRLIQDVLTFARVPRSAVRLEPVDLNAVLRDILAIHPEFQPPHAHIALEQPLPRVEAHRSALAQCLTNLLTNAVKFVADGVSPRVRVWAEAAPGPIGAANAETAGSHPSSPRIRLCIQDNGVGIPPDGHECIFGIFQRLSTEHEGTGIGLAIVRKAAERMGGRVGLTSEPGHGSTFWLELGAA